MLTNNPSCVCLLITDCTCKCGDGCQHQGSLWALPRARLSALCQALLMRASASLQRFWRDESNTSLCGRSTCEEWQSTRAQPHSFPGHLRSLLCRINVILLIEVFSTLTWKIAFHVLPSASRRRSLSLQPLKYKTHGGRNCARSDANSCTKQNKMLH